MNNCPHSTAHYFPIIFLWIKFLVKQQIEPCENILTQSVTLFLVSLIPPCSHCDDSYLPFFSLFHRPPCWPNQSRNICCGTHKRVSCAFRSLTSIVWLYLAFFVLLTALFAVLRIIQITMQPIFSLGNAFSCTVLIAIGWMTVDSFDSADI